MTFKQPFAPHYGATVPLSGSTIAATATVQRGNKQWRITNKGTEDIFCRGYDSRDGAQTATTADFPVMGGQSTTITVPEGYDKMSYVTSSGTATGYLTPGEGF